MGKQKTVAVIDVGSHEITMKIARLKSNSAPVIIDEIQRTVPTGVDTFTTGKISQYSKNQIINVLQDFKNKTKDYQTSDIRAVATSAFREADNGLYVIDQIQIQTGIRVKVLSASMDNYYLQLGLSEGLPGFLQLIEEGLLALTIGSGGIHLTLYSGGKFINSQRFAIGSLRIRELLGDLERQTSDFNALLTEYISGDLSYYRAFNSRQTEYKNLVVLGGSMRYMKYVAQWDRPNEERIKRDEFLDLLRRLKSRERRTLARIAKIPTEHESLLAPGGIIIEEVLAFTGIDSMFMPNIDLHDGIFYEILANEFQYTLQRDPFENMMEAARNIAGRYRIDKNHIRHVRDLALKLFDLTAKLHCLPDRARKYLALSSVMHNVGKYISMMNNDAHTYEIIMSSEIIGLDDEEKEMVALIARFHNGRLLPKDPMLKNLGDEDKRMVLKIIAILSVANALDAGHKQKIEILQTRILDDLLQIIISAKQDYTIENWTLANHSALFSEVFGYRPVLKLRKNKTA